ncbi:MAG: HEAT repeat domain-containing protein [Candidatus Anstonellales archaeon]
MRSESLKRVDRLISQSYDSNPNVRLRVVSELSTILEEPGAVFALLELASDKDEKVRAAAQEVLSRIKQKEDVMSIEKLFLQSEAERLETETDVKEKLFPSIEKLFTNKKTKRRLMSSLEKLFSEKKKHRQSKVEDVSSDVKQTVLKDHIEILSPIEPIGEFEDKEKIAPPKTVTSPSHSPLLDIKEITEGRERQETIHESASSTSILEETQKTSVYEEAFRRAYLLASEGEINEKALLLEEKKMIAEMTSAVKAAFKAAREKAKNAPTPLSSLRPGMRKIKTSEVTVAEVNEVDLTKGKRKTKLLKLLILDNTGKFPLYLPELRGKGINVGDHLIVEGAYVADTEDGTGQALFLESKGRLLLIK